MAKGWSFGAFVNQFYDLVYPVGICIDFTNTTDPNVAFPGTTWVRISDGKVVRAATSNTVGSGKGQINGVAGSDTATLSAENMPEHDHDMQHTHDIGHQHPRATTNDSGVHSHHVSGLALDGGEHYHVIASIMRQQPNSNHTSGGSAGSWGNKNTNNGGIHSHQLDGTAEDAGVHNHWTDVPAHVGDSGASSTSRTGKTGGTTGVSAPVNVANDSRYYARWNRTA